MMKRTLVTALVFAALRVGSIVKAQNGLVDSPCRMGKNPCHVPSTKPHLQGLANVVCGALRYALPFAGDFSIEMSKEIFANPDAYHATGLGSKFSIYFNVTSSNDDLCVLAKEAYPLCNFCAVVRGEQPDNFCLFQDGACNKPKVVDPRVNVTNTCQVLQALYDIHAAPYTTDLCYRAEQSSWACPMFCDLYQTYLGANTLPKKKALVWLARSAAILSFFGASYILWDVLSKPKNRVTVFHQLLGAMAFFDLITAFAWSFSTAALPVQDDFHAGFYYQAKGNDQTCKAQSFLVQLGFTSVFYNVSLALYYVMVIHYRVHEQRLKRLRPLLHGIPLVVGFGLAFGILPVYEWSGFGCYLGPQLSGVEAAHHWKAYVFVLVPIGLSILSITVSMIFLYCSVRRTSRAAVRWRLSPQEGSNSMERRVFWQALFYALSFYITWPILFVYFTGRLRFNLYLLYAEQDNTLYRLACTISFVAPLQGFNNFLVYVRPRAFKAIQQGLSLLKLTLSKQSLLTFGSDRTSEAKAESAEQSASELEQGHTDGVNNNNNDDEYMDPSAQIALENEFRSQIPETEDAEVSVQEPTMGRELATQCGYNDL